MRKTPKVSRKLKNAALITGLLSMLCGCLAARAAEYAYDGDTSAGVSYAISPGRGSQASEANQGEYVSIDTINDVNNTYWFSYSGGNGKKGVWRQSAEGDPGNSLIISYGNKTAPAFVFGGVAAHNSAYDVSGNQVHYSGGANNNSADLLAGGVSYSGKAGGSSESEGNKVYYYGGGLNDVYTPYTNANAMYYSIIGGIALGAGGSADYNLVSVTGNGNISGSIHGGRVFSSDTSSASNNKVEIGVSGAFTGIIGRYDHHANVTGGNLQKGVAENNSVVIQGTSKENKLKVYATITGGGHENSTQNVIAIYNSVKLEYVDNNYSISSGGNVYANRSNGDAIGKGDDGDPDIYIKDSDIKGNVISGNDNIVSNGDKVLNHSIRLIGTTVGGSVYGGLFNSNGSNLEASDNQILIVGGEFKGNIAGVMFNGSGSDNKANDNIITLSGEIIFNSASLHGYLGDGVASENAAGNALNIYGLAQAGSGISTVSNFNEYNFQIDCGKVAGANDPVGDFALTATNIQMGGATVESIEITGGGKLNDGDQVGLMQASNDLNSTVYVTPQTAQGQQGLTDYEFAVALDNKQLIATVKNSQAKPTAKSLSAGYLSGHDLLNRGADLLERKGLMDAGEQAWREKKPAVFAAMRYNDTRTDAGAHLDVTGTVLAAGLAQAKKTARGGRASWGGFFEAGWGNYGSSGSFGGASVKGGGDIGYRGLGLLARHDHARRGAERTYIEGSLRAGRIKTGFRSSDILPGTDASYRARSAYCGSHIGLGYVRELKAGASLDLYAKLLYTRTGGDAVDVLGNPVEFDAVNSLRLRAGARYAKEAKAKNSFYLGLAYEHEFNGRARGSANGSAIDAPEMKGGTGIGEVGLAVKGGRGQADIRLEGYAGKRKGVGFGAEFKWFF